MKNQKLMFLGSLVSMFLIVGCSPGTVTNNFDKFGIDTTVNVGDSAIKEAVKSLVGNDEFNNALKEAHKALPNDNAGFISDNDKTEINDIGIGKKFVVKNADDSVKFEEVFSNEEFKLISETIKSGKKIRLISDNKSTKISLDTGVDIVIIKNNQDTIVEFKN